MLLLLAILALSTNTRVWAWYCEGPDWIEYHGNCYNFGGSFNRYSADCKANCAGQGARMLCIEDADRENYVHTYAATSSAVWLDYSDATSEGTYTWGAGCENTGYKNWQDPNAESQGTSMNCAALQADNWYAYDCDYIALCYCEKPAIASTPDCPAGWILNGDVCYLIDLNKPATSWDECQDTCIGYHGRMLCMRDASDESYIVNSMGTLPSVWLSYIDAYREGNWYWSANCDYTSYTNWDTASSEPNGGNAENCAALYGNQAGSVGWKDEVCGITGIQADNPKYCFCEGSSGDPYLLPYRTTPAPTAPPTYIASVEGKTNVIWVVVTIVSLFGLIGSIFCVAYCYSWWKDKRQQYAAVARTPTPAAAPSPRVPSASPGTYAYSGAPSGAPSSQHAAGLPGRFSVPYSAYNGGNTGLNSGGSVQMVPLPQLGSSAPPALAADDPVLPPITVVVATATAVPYSGVSTYDNYGDSQVVMAEAVVASADV